MAGAAAAAVASGISTRPATPSRALIGRRARSVVRAVVTVERGEKAYTVQKSEEIFNAAKVLPLCLLRVSGP
jgi:glutamate-1-semialdehyde 2,1-aminomutase